MKTLLEKIRAHRPLLYWVIFSTVVLGSLLLYFTARTDAPIMTLLLLAVVLLANLLAMLL